MFDRGVGVKNKRGMSRRKLLKELLATSSVLGFPFHKFRWSDSPGLPESDSFRGGRLLGVVPFTDEGSAPLDEPLGAELDGRLFTDLSTVKPENPLTLSREFYLRTRASRVLDTAHPWFIRVTGLIEKPFTLLARDLESRVRPMGIHLMECAGNSRNAHFGLLSVADWEGVTVEEMLEDTSLNKPGARVLISGFDNYLTESRSSIPGASWIFTMEQLTSARAFLATKMNGEPLTVDHGAPVRLVVPGWYGCTCIKWVKEISFVAEEAPATSQMQEYAGRTNQDGMPGLASEFQPAIIDYGALPVRIEKWLLRGNTRFRVAGIHWGGSRPIDGLEIRFSQEEDFVAVEDLQPSEGDRWGFWSHVWIPSKPGRYLLRLRLKERAVAARRLNSGYYQRSVEIKEIS
jgi:DMSO/TMAO reductase YedYZ molybdopterin-dependent catalytic subunit